MFFFYICKLLYIIAIQRLADMVFCGGNEFVGLKNIDVAYGGAAKRLVSVQTILINKTFYN